MDGTSLFLMIVAGVSVIAIILFGKSALRLLVEAAGGVIIVMLCGYILAPSIAPIGINPITCAVIAVLGLPGIISMFIAQILL